MVRRVLNDEIWTQLQVTLKSKGCYSSKKGHEIKEAIFKGSFASVHPRGIFQENFVRRKQRTTALIDVPKKVCG